MVIEVLLAAIVVLLLVLIYLQFKRGKVGSKDIESAISKAMKESGLEQSVGELTAHARDIKDSHRSIEQMLRVPKERGSLGEMGLEVILEDQLPPDMFGIRTKCLDGKNPDAHIDSTVGVICIDSKFPLDNYRMMAEATDAKDKEGFKRQFIKDVQGHLDKICSDYVCPQNGSAEFAFAYIPSEGVYYFLVTEAYQLLQDFSKKGVQVVSPLTLSHKVQLIKAGVHAKKLSEDAERVGHEIAALAAKFADVDHLWGQLYGTHLRNAGNKADELESAYGKLRGEFRRISTLSEAQDSKEGANLVADAETAKFTPEDAAGVRRR